MSEWNTDISPITKTKTIIYSKYRILIDRIYFGENKADVKVILCNEDETESKEFFYALSSIEYLNWQSDSSLREALKQKIRNETF